MRFRRLLPAALLLLTLAMACYTRLNHPTILAESRNFAPAPDSDCLSCHDSGDDLAIWSNPHDPMSFGRERDRWDSFRHDAWWRGGALPPTGSSSGGQPAGLVPSPTPAPDAKLPEMPAVMGLPGSAPRRDPAAAPASPPDSAQGKASEPKRPVRRPRVPKPDAPIAPAQPAPEDSLRKSS